ncbi:MAG: hypothetical protein AAF039_02905 [Bacteroidota bacterium]
MIKLFRRIRQSLLAQSKFRNYLLYALGEILLVVIGILLALQINNWNDNRKSRLKIDQVLKKVRDELVLNIQNSDDVTAFYRFKEKSIGDVLRKKVTMEDYENSGLVYLIWNNTTLDLSDDAARELDGYSDLLSREQDTLISKINQLYASYKPTLDDSDEEIGEVVNDFEARLKKTTSWYYLSNNREDLPRTAYHFFLNDTLYLNDVAYYESTGLNNHFRYTAYFNGAAKDLYSDLSNYLRLALDSTLIRPVDQFEHYQGTYVLQNQQEKDTFIIRKKNNKLVYDWIDENGSDTYSLYPESKDEFVLAIWFAKLIRDERNEVIGFKLTLGSRPEQEYLKIK